MSPIRLPDMSHSFARLGFRRLFGAITAVGLVFGIVVSQAVASNHVQRFVSSSVEDGSVRTSTIGLLYQRTSDLTTVCQSYLLIEPISELVPIATLVLFVGGAGRIGVFDQGVGVRANNFLYRTRYQFAASGPFNVALIDAPEPNACTGAFSNLFSLNGLRASNPHAEDMGLVMDDLRSQLGGSVWVVGTSRGTISAAFAAAVLSGTSAPDGLVLTATLTREERAGRNDVFDVPLSQVTVPTLIVSHKDDGCEFTPPVDWIQLWLILRQSAPDVRAWIFRGGLPPISDPCNALSDHGFFGIERRVVSFISNWVINRTP